MVASGAVSEDPQVDQDNVLQGLDETRLLCSAAIYGANASGKSNLVAAIRFMQNFIRKSSTDSQAEDVIDVEPFLLNTSTENEPSLFEIVLIADEVEYRYGFQVTQNRVIAEWLFGAYSTKETTLFTRDEHGIKLGVKLKAAKHLTELTRPNALFLSVAAQFNNPIALSIIRWFARLEVASGLQDGNFWMQSLRSLGTEETRSEILSFITRLDVGISDLRLSSDVDSTDIKAAIMSLLRSDFMGETPSIITVHNVFDPDGARVGTKELTLSKHESQGTRKLIALAAPLLSVLKRGGLMFIDEFDARLHPIMTRSLVQLFATPLVNIGSAQLIFVTHDTNLLDKHIFRRDQIWFTEKDSQGATHLTSLVEYKVRNTESFEKNYVQGRYGGIPFLGDLTRLPGEYEHA